MIMNDNENHKLRLVLEYLHECLLNNSISENTSNLSTKGFEVVFLKGKTIDNLSEIRDHLLSQVNFSKKS